MDGDRLLVPYLVNRYAVSVGHLIELVDATHTAVGEHLPKCQESSEREVDGNI